MGSVILVFVVHGAQPAGAFSRSISNVSQFCSQLVIPSLFLQMTSGTTTAEYSESESAKKANVLIPIENKCTHFSFSLVLLVVPDDGLPN